MVAGVTLDELHVLVPSTEEYDLAEELEVERLHAWLVREYAALLGPLDDDPLPGAPAVADAAGGHSAADDAPVEDDTEPGWRPSDAQALGCVEHLLGAQVIPPDADPDPDPPADPPATPPARPSGIAEDPAG